MLQLEVYLDEAHEFKKSQKATHYRHMPLSDILTDILETFLDQEQAEKLLSWLYLHWIIIIAFKESAESVFSYYQCQSSRFPGELKFRSSWEPSVYRVHVENIVVRSRLLLSSYVLEFCHSKVHCTWKKCLSYDLVTEEFVKKYENCVLWTDITFERRVVPSSAKQILVHNARVQGYNVQTMY